MEEISLSINGKNITCPSGTSILGAATKNGIQIPTLCHHPHLKPAGACRLCLVEEEKSGRILASCVTPAKESETICGFCGVGCSLVMGSVDGQIVDVNPSKEKETVNQSTLCVRGHFAQDFLNASDRLTHPWVRKNGELCPATWEKALDLVSKGLLKIKREKGSQSLGFLGSSKCTVEENYLFQKIARVLLGTNNVDNGGYGSGRVSAGALCERLGGGRPHRPIGGIGKG